MQPNTCRLTGILNHVLFFSGGLLHFQLLVYSFVVVREGRDEGGRRQAAAARSAHLGDRRTLASLLLGIQLNLRLNKSAWLRRLFPSHAPLLFLA